MIRIFYVIATDNEWQFSDAPSGYRGTSEDFDGAIYSLHRACGEMLERHSGHDVEILFNLDEAYIHRVIT